jgi:FKBP-type peptidyl-prolyl cis-trans isomerase FkpA
MKRFARTLIGLLAVTLIACDKDPVTPPEARIEDAVFASELGINLSLMTRSVTGLYLQNLVVGTGTPAAALSWASVRYTGWFPDGTQFDSNIHDDAPWSFTVLSGSAIPGFIEGVRGMQVGGVRRLIIPPSLAYGSTQFQSIPPNSILVFEVELVALQP